MALAIRRAALADLSVLTTIEARGFPDPWPEEALASYLEDPRTLVLLAEGPEPVGFLIARVEGKPGGPKAVHIHDLAVDPPYRRQGVGTALLAELVRRARRIRALRIVLEVRVGNEGARRFYHALGFEVTAEVPGYYEDGEGALRMELDLSRPSPLGTRGRG